jgi:hypothetical protein
MKTGDSEVWQLKRKYRIKSKSRFIAFLAIALFLTISAADALTGENHAESLTRPVYSEIVIQYGDTLWNLAREFGPGNQDVRETVYEICRINDISVGGIYPGQAILVPYAFQPTDQ